MTTPAVTSIVIDTQDIEPLIAFWGALLDIEVSRQVGPWFAWMSPVTDGGPALAFQKVPEEKAGKNRLHLDLHVATLEEGEARVVELGGSKVDEHSIQGFTWYVMADPQGNEFCIAAG